ncbi:hypothetical protein I0C86_19360 [Plantactinospora sp. S1510]|uniref:Invertebrate defensins family profile domain-containing protein n=1 Tax=Plantactinospora alkalitolerans TaxID=2789879 RepID=A0ABS0GYE9_9ACTN|nr:hypothetical protein [Plantactinospora alkalitolerans]MBF9131101.1 hypothetical protein [Plantactinospora alkalitolerans]
MSKLRALTDRLVGLVVPEVKASALWYTETRCVSGCGGRGQEQRRQCHDGSGVCGAWTNYYCGC